MKKKRSDTIDCTKAIEHYKNSQNIEKTAKLFNMSGTTLYYALINAEVSIKSKKFSSEVYENIINLRKQGNSIKEINEKTGIQKQTVRNILFKNKLYEKVYFPIYTREVRNTIINLYNKGLNLKECSKIVNINAQIIKNILIEENITIRKFKNINNLPSKEQLRKYHHDKNYFKIIDREDKAYFLGLLVADGHNDMKGFKISLQNRDTHILEKFKECMKSDNKIFAIESKSQSLFQINDVDLSKDLCNLGVFKNKTYNASFPNIPECLWHHFIRGVFDGDGCITLGKKINTNYPTQQFSIIGNFELINRIQDILVEKCGVNKTKLAHNKRHPLNIISVIYAGRINCLSIRNWLYKDATIYLTRKYEKFYSISEDFGKWINNKNKVKIF